MPGSPPVIRATTADALPRESIKASVDDGRMLRYDVRPRPGQVVTFVERGPEVAKELGSVKGGKGVLPFTPADGRAGPRTIEARVAIDGLVTSTKPVATYRAPGPPAPGRPDGVEVDRRSNTELSVRWGRAANADGWNVVVRFANGTRRVFAADADRRAVRVPGVLRDDAGTVTVRAVTRRGATVRPRWAPSGLHEAADALRRLQARPRLGLRRVTRHCVTGA